MLLARQYELVVHMSHACGWWEQWEHIFGVKNFHAQSAGCTQELVVGSLYNPESAHAIYFPTIFPAFPGKCCVGLVRSDKNQNKTKKMPAFYLGLVCGAC